MQISKTPFQVYNASAGSGKTFTLVKEYLKILLKSSDKFRFQHILAITFTNKAAAEMKIRIIASLRAFSETKITVNENALFAIICTELDVEPTIIHQRSQKILKSILNNYAAFNITTIDSFTYKLIRSFAYDLGLSLNFEVEMDAISLLNEAVDVLISRIGEEKELTKTLIDFSIAKANEDKSWDITLDLKEIAKLLLNENDTEHISKITQKPIQDFIALKKQISKQQKEIEKQFAQIGETAIALINTTTLTFKDFAYSDLPNHFKKLTTAQLHKINFEGRLYKNIENEHLQYTSKATSQVKSEIDGIRSELTQHYYQSKTIYETHYPTYVLNSLISKSIIPLAVLRTINEVLTEIKEDNNIRLNSEFNQIISKHIREQPVAFIYEKIGEKFQHYFIDEMQDTSVMQWQNLIPLIDNVLESESSKGEKGSLLLVGDAKQAIYRWRGGKAEQFINISDTKGDNPFLIPKKVNQLETNWRSYSQIIEFNNTFFQHIAAYLKNETYRELYTVGNQQKQNEKKGGFVQISFIEEGLAATEKELVYAEKVLEIIQNIENEFDKNEICILTRTRKQGIAVAEYLSKNNIAIISSETLLLQNSADVTFIVNLLGLINQPENTEIKFEVLYYLYKHLQIEQEKHLFITSFLNLELTEFFEVLQKFDIQLNLDQIVTLSLYDTAEAIIRIFKLTETSDAHIQFFLDVVLDFSHKKSEGIDSFLIYWHEKKDKLSIVVPEGKNAVQIMTIHKSKGLEFPVVIYPFDLDIYRQIKPKVWYKPLPKETYNNFEAALVNYGTTLQKTGTIGKAIYQNQQEELELDNINLLYVALTRAEEQLYIINEFKKEADEPRFYSQFFIAYLKSLGRFNLEQSTYKFGKIKRLSKKKKHKNSKEQEEFISSNWKNHNINIVINPFKNTTDSAREYGNLIHEILAKIITEKDSKPVISSYINNGLIAFTEKEKFSTIIQKISKHPKLKMYFANGVSVLNEREIITDSKQIIIPDRLVFNGNKVTIIDYKTGKQEKAHTQQINNYASVLTKMNYTVTSKLLVYINNEVTVVAV